MIADIRQTAVRLLTRREHSQVELQRKLQLKYDDSDATKATIKAVVQSLYEKGLQSDARFTESYIRMRAGRGYGPARIHMELNERGSAGELIENYIQTAEIDWYALALQIKSKRFGGIKVSGADLARQMRFLQYRGFTHEQIKSCF